METKSISELEDRLAKIERMINNYNRRSKDEQYSFFAIEGFKEGAVELKARSGVIRERIKVLKRNENE